MDWSTTDDLDAQVRRLWERGRLLTEAGESSARFPLALRVRRPDSRELAERFDDVRRWIRGLEDGSLSCRGFGYELVWTEIDHRQLGRNRVPTGAVIPTREDALRIVGKQRQANRFAQLASATHEAWPELRGWIERKPMVLLEHADDWEKVLATLAWFRAHPRPGIFLRQLDIAGVDTKFIETRKGLLMELLDIVLPPENVDPLAKRHFEGRYGLLSKPPLVRFRILDAAHRIGGLSDITVPATQFAALRPAWKRVFITENEINGLAFPDLPDAAVVFGLGYALDRLTDVGWLRDRPLYYWGDIDTHGFAILDRLRASFPTVSSLLMDRETLTEHRSLWVQEEARHAGPLVRLNADEQDVFKALVSDQLGDRVRLEQERIGFGWATRALEALGHAG